MSESKQFEFLKGIKLREDIGTRPIRMSERHPEGLALRIFRNGRVFPSHELTEKFSLEYNVDLKGNGVDFFSSTDWKPYPATQTPAVLISFTPRKVGEKQTQKLDLFTSVKKKNQEITTAEEKTVTTHGPRCMELWDLVVSTYNLKPTDETIFIDLDIHTDLPINTENNIYLIPKKLARGKNKGDMGYVRRENITLYLLLPKPTKKVDTQVEAPVEAKANEVQQPDLMSMV